jgi:undecaprenyl-diphosphatase
VQDTTAGTPGEGNSSLEWYHAIILGIVEGITEFLPISSTGHLIIVASLLGMTDDAEFKRSLDGYLVIIQGASLLAIVGLYWPRLKQMLLGLLGREDRGRKLLLHLIIAFLPIFILGPLLHSHIEAWLFRPWPVLAALFLGGVWMIWIDHRRKQLGEEHFSLDIDHMTWKHALGIGLFQCLSMWPGTSRAMMTIAGGTVLGLRPAQSAEFSFLLGLPTIAGATVYVIGKEYLMANDEAELPGMIEQLGLWPMLLGCIVTIICAALAVKWLISFLSRHGLSLFGWYRIALCIVMGSLVFGGLVVL